MEKNFKDEMGKLCDTQIRFWNELKDALSAIDNFTDFTEKEICETWHKHFKENNEVLQQLIKVKMTIDEIER